MDLRQCPDDADREIELLGHRFDAAARRHAAEAGAAPARASTAACVDTDADAVAML